MTSLRNAISTAVAAVALLPTAAQAQQYLLSETSEPWVEIANIPNIGTITPFTRNFSSSSDDGAGSVMLPFSYTFFGASHNQAYISTNGFMSFASASVTTFSNRGIPTTSAPNSIIAPWWDDLQNFNTELGRTGVIGTSPNRIFVIQSDGLRRLGTSSGEIKYQVWLYEGPAGRFDVRVTGSSGSTSNSATSGYEGANATPSGVFRPCGSSGNCNDSDLTNLAGRSFAVFLAQAPELSGAISNTFPRGAFPGDSAQGSFTVQNQGLDDATDLFVEMYLSTDSMLDPSDALVGTTTVANVPGQNTATGTITITVPSTATVADFTLIMKIDANDQFMEANETDNVVTGAIGFATGYDLQPTGISSTNGANPGDTVQFDVNVTNNGVPRVGSLDIEVYASADQIYDAGDTLVGAVTVTLAGNNVESFQVTSTLPQLAPGNYYPVARVDPNNTLVEMNELNNEYAASTPFPTGPDFTINSVSGPAQIAPGASGQFSVTVGSVAVPYTGSVDVRLYLSTDTTLDMADYSLGDYTVTLSGGSTGNTTPTITFPNSLPPAGYYVIAQADPTNQVTEVDEMNNNGASTSVVSNAYDFSIGNVSFTPGTSGAGGQIQVVAQVRSTGVPFVGDLPYAVYLSSDNIFDPGDELIHSGNQFVAGLSTASLTTDITLSNRVPIASWHVIVVADPNNALAESDEANNAGASNGRLTINGADLYISQVAGPSYGFIGRTYPLSVTILNEGQADANNFRFAVYSSDNEFITINDPQIYISQSATIAQGGQQSFQVDVQLPTFTSSQTVWLGVIVDIYSNVPESRESNNVRRIPDAVSVVFPIPDLEGDIIATATAAGAGEPLSVTRIIRNVGVADANNVLYRYYLSNNPTIAADDIPLGDFRISIPENGDDYQIETLSVPSGVMAGTYYLGMSIDPDNTTDEVDDSNNIALGPQVRIYDAGIQFLTRELPQATVGVIYQAGIYANGGALGRTWTIEGGTLPPGLNLDSTSGIIQGSPTQEGNYTFTVRASSSAGQADAEFSIRVLEPTIQLAILTETLPSGIVGREYRARVIPIGGAPPYTFEATNANATIPGLNFTADGVLYGTPTAPTAGTFGVRVTDSLGETASRSLAVNIINAGDRLKIRQIALRDAVVDQPYCDEMAGEFVTLSAEDGTEPFSWSQIGDAVPGMTINEVGQLCGTPTMAGEFPLTVRVQDATGQFDTALFILRVNDGNQMAISTTDLPVAEKGKAYEATLTAFGGTDPLTWAVVNGSLPDGISLDAQSGVISGTPAEEGTSAFIVAVTDAQMRFDSFPLSIRVTSAESADGGSGSDDGCGCNTTRVAQGHDSLVSLLMLLGLGGLLMFNRRRLGLLVGLVGLASLVGGSAVVHAQPVAGTNYQMTRSSINYTNLTNPTVLWTARADENTQSISLPFQFKFYDNSYGEVIVGLNGGVQFGSGTRFTRSNPNPGSSTTPNGFIAPFQDDLFINNGQNGQVGYKVQGTAPTRSITFEWRDVDRYFSTAPDLNFQLTLFEGPSGRIQVRYGSTNGSRTLNGTMGMEDESGGRPIFFEPGGCTTSCTLANFNNMTNQQVELVQDPGVELIGLEVVAPQFGYLGAPMNVEVTLGNLHGNAVGPFNFELRVARTRDMANATTIYTSSALTFQAFQILTTNVEGIPPPSLPEGEYYIAAVVDSSNSVMEVAEDNNQIVSMGRVRLLEGKPDLRINRVTASETSASSGDTVNIQVEIENAGSDAANNVALHGMLSTNLAISTRDVDLGSITVSLAPGETKTETIAVILPGSINSGTYWLGAYADPQGLIEELNESNNSRAALTALNIAGGNLAILTQALPNGYVGVTYVALLSAVGGEGNYNWSISTGKLPTGLGLVPSTGEIFGRPLRSESETLTVEVQSGNDTQSQQLTVVVADPSAPLTIVTRSAPPAVVGQEYSYALQTTGGTSSSTLTWTADTLPSGVMLTSTGILAGTPDTAGTSTIAVTVNDGTDTAQRSIIFEVRNNANLLIDTVVPPVAQYNAAYNFQLTAKGGVPPLTWVLDQGSLPEGMELSPDGMVSGTPQRVGGSRVVIEVRDSASGSLSSRDSNTFEFKVADVPGFSITTEELPIATVGQAYVMTGDDAGGDVEIKSNGGAAPISWKIVQGRLPDRLFGEEIPQTGAFRISGSALEADEINLLVEATDAHGRVAQKAFLLRVEAQVTASTDATSSDDGGCSCSVAESGSKSSAGALLGTLLILGMFVARRRRF